MNNVIAKIAAPIDVPDFDDDFITDIKFHRGLDQEILDIIFTNPLFERLDFRKTDKVLNTCYDGEDKKEITFLLNKRNVHKLYQYSYPLISIIIMNPNLEEEDKCEMIERLLFLGDDINQKSVFSETPLFLATISRQKRVVECLLKNGANPNIESVYNLTPLIAASYFSDFFMASMLVHYKANINAKLKNGWSVMDCAYASKNTFFAEMMYNLGARGGEYENF